MTKGSKCLELDSSDGIAYNDGQHCQLLRFSGKWYTRSLYKEAE